MTFTVRLPAEVTAKLGELSRRTDRTQSNLVADAIADFVQRELDIVAAIERGLDDVQSGRLVPHDEAMRRVFAAIALGSAAKP